MKLTKHQIFDNLSNVEKIVIVLIALLLISVPSIIFICNFHDSSISNDILKWGAFGDFIAGITGTIIALANLIFLIFITIQLSHIDSNRETENLKFQTLISLNEIRNDSYKEVTRKLRKFTTASIMAKANNFEEATYFVSEVETFCQTMTHLFPSLEIESNYKPLIECMIEILNSIRLRTGELSQNQKDDAREATDKYSKKRDDFIKNLQNDIVSTNPINLIINESV